MNLLPHVHNRIRFPWFYILVEILYGAGSFSINAVRESVYQLGSTLRADNMSFDPTTLLSLRVPYIVCAVIY